MSKQQPTVNELMDPLVSESREGEDLDQQNFEWMISEYLKGIELPKEKPVQKFFLCPIGLVGAGKSTVIKPLSKHFGLARVSGDEIRKQLKEHGYNFVRTKEIASHITQRLLKDGYGIALDSDCVGQDIQEIVRKAAAEYSYKIFYIHINPPEEFILNKLKNFRHTWLFKDADDAIQHYYRRKPMHENLTMDFIYTFDTSKADLDRQMAEAISVIEDRIR